MGDGSGRSEKWVGLDHRSFLLHVNQLAALRARFSAASVVNAVLDAWYRKSYPRLAPGRVATPPSLNGNGRIEAFATALSRQPLLEAAYWLSSAYAKLLQEDRRKQLSMYFTPPTLASRVLGDLAARGAKFDKDVFLDPACGGSAFLVPIALRMKQSMKGRISAEGLIEHLQAHLLGIEVDETLCVMSRQFLRGVLYEEIAATSLDPEFQVSKDDSLRNSKHLDEKIDVVVCNPPYRKMSAHETQSLSADFSSVLSPQPNLYGVFIARCILFLKRRGLCTVVTPTSFLSGHSFAKLRKFITEDNQVLSVGILSQREGVFIDVQQETAVTTIRRGSKKAPPATSVSLISPIGRNDLVGVCRLPCSEAAWPVPRASSDVVLIRAAEKLKHRIGDYGYQIRIGNHVWNRDKRKAYLSEKIAKRFNKSGAVPLIWSSDIKAGEEVRFDGRKKDNGERRFVVYEDGDNPSVIRKPCVLLQRVTCNHQQRRLVAAAVPESFFRSYGGFVGENHTIILIPKVARPRISPRQLAALLGCNEIDRLYRCISGAANVSVFELGQLPLPDPNDLKRALQRGVSVELAVKQLMGLSRQ